MLIFRESMPSHFKVKEYCPLVFRNLRERFSIDDMDFMVDCFSFFKTVSCKFSIAIICNCFLTFFFFRTLLLSHSLLKLILLEEVELGSMSHTIAYLS